LPSMFMSMSMYMYMYVRICVVVIWIAFLYMYMLYLLFSTIGEPSAATLGRCWHRMLWISRIMVWLRFMGLG
jgi:hypothetical protein